MARTDLLALELAAESVDECLALLMKDYSTGAHIPAPSPLAEIRVSAWKSALEQDGSGYIARCAQEAGLAVENIAAALRELPAETFASGWASEFASLVAGGDAPEQNSQTYPFSQDAYPFGQVLWPICQRAGRELKGPQPVPEPVLEGFHTWLLTRLVEYCAPALYGAFTEFRAAQTNAHKEGIYQQFCCHLQSGGLDDFLRDRPPLARIITTITTQSVDFFHEFLTRMTADLPAISEMSGGKTLALEAVSAGLSDAHNGGKTVVRVSFSGGIDLYYKPRGLSPERNWACLLDWLEAAGGLQLDLYPQTLCRIDYGWQLACSREGCLSPGAYFKNLGFQLAVFRAVGSSDMHHENVIASGNTPFFIDLETLFSPLPRFSLWPNNALRAADDQLIRSVWRSGVLPDATLLPSGAVMRFGALAEAPATSGPVWGFDRPNTDGMSFVPRDSQVETFDNLPLWRGPAPPAKYLNDLEDGFRKGISLIRARWDEFSGLCDRLSGPTSSNRAIFRPTAVYAAAIHTLRDPRRLGNGIEWSARLDFGKANGRSLGILGDRHFIAAERRALLRGDIPYFVTRECGAVTDSMGCIIPDAVEALPPIGSLQPPNDLEIDRDVRLIRWSVGDLKPARIGAWPEVRIDPSEARILVEAEVARIVDLITSRAIVADDGAAWWGRVSLLAAPSIAVLGPGLYDGVAGIGLFLAMAGKWLDIEPARDLARQAFNTVHAMVGRHQPSSAAPQRTIGLASGMIGVAYAALLTSDLALARKAASLATDESVLSDQSFDLLNGSAGALVVLLHLWEATCEPRWLEKAQLCGERLVEGHRAKPYWRTNQGISAGMAHGLAGIGLSLCRLGRALDRADFLRLGLHALETADGAYDPRNRDWAAHLNALPASRSEHYWNRWCHGAVGVGLAWREQAPYRSAMSADIVARAIEASLQNSTRPYDNLCCGNIGHVDFLLEMTKEAGALRLEEIAWQRAVWLISARRGTGYVCDDATDRATLGLFSGISGIGYNLIRLLHPKRVPSLLAVAAPVACATTLA